jgi:hypothetical protein
MIMNCVFQFLCLSFPLFCIGWKSERGISGKEVKEQEKMMG